MVLEGSGLWECREEDTQWHSQTFHTWGQYSIIIISCAPFLAIHLPDCSFKCIVDKQRKSQKQLSIQGDPISVCALRASPIIDATFLSVSPYGLLN